MPHPPYRNELPQTLDYGRPAPPARPSDIFGGIFGILAAIVAVPAWGMGIWVLVHALFHSLRADRERDLSVAGVFLGIAIVCTVAAFRWIRDGFGRPSRRDLLDASREAFNQMEAANRK
jgi:hypothetical protein